MSEPRLITCTDWRRAYAGGASPRVLLTALARRLAEHPAAGVDWIHLAGAAALEPQIAALGAALSQAADRGAWLHAHPWFGLPYAVKDNLDVAGLPTTAACPAYAYRPERHAHAVQRLADAGAVCMGKTNLDQFATGLVGARSPYGRPSSSFDATRISGGSSSGSAVVVARGDLPLALATDTAGSGRVPAGFNQIVGLKPTPGRVGNCGMVPACRTLDCVAVFAQTVEDAAAALALIEGVDAGDAYSRFEPGPAHLGTRVQAGTPRPAGGLRIGVPAAPTLDPMYVEAWSAALAAVRAQGHEGVELDFAPMHAVAALLYDGPWVAERHAAVQGLLERAPEAFDPTVRRVIEGAIGRTATEAFRGQYRLRAAQQAAAALWRQVDLLMVPTAPGHPTHAEVDADPIGVNSRLGTYTNYVNLLGWCALALPAGLTASGLPFGVSFLAPGGADAALARFGAAWQRALSLPLGATDARLPALGDAPAWPASEPVLPIAVVGAHLSGMPLNGQLLERGARLCGRTRTAAHYRLHLLQASRPPKPGLVRVAGGGRSIEVEVWELPQREIGSFLALIAAPLGLGSVELADGRWVHGFVCEALAVQGAPDISDHGGWRAWRASLEDPGTDPGSRPTELPETR